MSNDLSILPIPTSGNASSTEESSSETEESGSTAGTASSTTSTASSDTSSTTSSTTAVDCVLGTVDDCLDCDDRCVGVDDEQTTRVCAADGCSLFCSGEFYDVNGDPDDGCEAEDVPLQDSQEAALAIVLPDVDDPTLTSNPLDIAGRLYGDDRLHDPPERRALGREDWYQVTTEGEGRTTLEMVACLGIVNFPPNNRFEVCISDAGADTFDAVGCSVTVGGGDSTCVEPPSGGNSVGPYYIRVRKLEGARSNLRYALFLAH